MFSSNFSQICLVLLCTVFSANCELELTDSPPHCTQISKNSIDYEDRYKLVYPTVYIVPGQQEAYQRMFCVNPPAVKSEVTVVCDWAAPPLVEFTPGDEYMHVVRQDPAGSFLGNAVINTYQLCDHDALVTDTDVVVTEVDSYNNVPIV